MCSEKSSVLVTFIISNIHCNILFIEINLSPDLKLNSLIEVLNYVPLDDSYFVIFHTQNDHLVSFFNPK